MEQQIKILVAAHKKVDIELNSCYNLIQVGCALNVLNFGYLCDNIGDNISSHNKQFCELTALFWGWKNLDCDISGLCHYRRFFVAKRFSSAKLCKQILDANKIIKILKNKKIIIPVESYRDPENPKLYLDREKSEQEPQLLRLEEYLCKNFPEYTPSVKKFMYGNKISWGNMFISSKEVYDKYCAWVFPILFELEKQFTQEKILYPRLMGYFAEILFCIWVHHNFKKKEVKKCQVINTEKPIVHLKTKKFLSCIGLYDAIIYIKHKIKYKKSKY